MAFHGLGVTEHSQGSKAVMLIANLAMLTGNLGRPGVGVNPLRGQNNVQGAADMGAQPHLGAGYLDLRRPEVRGHYRQVYGAQVPGQPGLTIPAMLEAACDGRLKGLWLMGEDLVQTDPNTAHVRRALQGLELLVVQELFLTPTAQLAHVVLPALSAFEKSGTFTNGERRIQRVNQVVAPLPGARSDGQILVDVMRALGYPQGDWQPAAVLEEIARAVPFFAGVRWEALGEEGKQWPVGDDGLGTPILHRTGFQRGRGRLHYFPWQESDELLRHRDRFPLLLTTGRHLVHYNAGTMTRRTANRELVGEDRLLIHPQDAGPRRIATGDRVRLTSARGAVELVAQLSREVRPGELFTTFHFPEAMVNSITSEQGDGETGCPEYKVTAVQVAPA
jgi:formate dehydrogenase major subunit